jgi:hypothetical protein
MVSFQAGKQSLKRLYSNLKKPNYSYHEVPTWFWFIQVSRYINSRVPPKSPISIEDNEMYHDASKMSFVVQLAENQPHFIVN